MTGTNRRDWYVPTWAAGDASNKIANTKFVQNAITAGAIGTIAISQLATIAGLSVLGNASTGQAAVSAIIGLPLANITSVAGLSVLGNASTASAVLTAIVGAADQIFAVNHAATTVLFRSLGSVIDTAMGSTQGDILIRGASNWTTLAPGGTGSTLTISGGQPAWTSAAVANMVLLNTLSPNGVASATDTTSLTGTYTNYLITFANVLPAASTANLMIQISTNAGGAWSNGTYVDVVFGVTSSGTGESAGTTGGIQLNFNGIASTAGSGGLNGAVWALNPAGGTARTTFRGSTSYINQNSVLELAEATGFQNSANNAVNGVAFLMSTGNIATGTIKIYGVS